VTDTIIKWAIRALLVAAVCGGIWYGIDSVAAAFRERKQLRYDVTELKGKVATATTERDDARTQAKAVADFAQDELRRRDEASRKVAATNRRIERELRDAKSKLAAWSASADAELARCLDRAVPRWLLDGSGEAPVVGPSDGRVPAPGDAAR
jgi:hypothetical protein